MSVPLEIEHNLNADRLNKYRKSSQLGRHSFGSLHNFT